MHFKIIEELKRATPKRRHALLMRMREKNLRHLHKWVPELAGYLETSGTGRFEVRIDEKFLDVLDRTTGEPCHPPGGLLPYMEQLGYRYHNGWVEKNAIAPLNRGMGVHGTLLTKFRERLVEALPELPARTAAGKILLPSLGNERAYSGPTVFLGIFTGFHIMYYLSRNETRDIFLIEPDLDRFAVSCFFLDYAALHEYYGHLLLHAGEAMPENPVDLLLRTSPVTASAWIRLLPAYPDGKFDDVIGRVGLRWAALNQVFVPMDREVRNLGHAMSNVKSQTPLMREPPILSANSRIAIVASGPSLNQDIPWLVENQDKLIIFSATSTVRALRQNGIRIDFQFALDTELTETELDQLQLDPDAPLVALHKLNPERVAQFPRTLLIVERFKANPVKFIHAISGTHPSTGNMATAVASWARPSELLFIGLDSGFRDAAESHYKGSLYDEDGGIGHVVDTRGKETQPVVANFPESDGQIVAQPYHTVSRLSIETVCARTIPAGTRIFNLSDGARIAGAEPKRSAELTLAPYPEREADVAAIVQAFATDHDGLWEPYAITGAERLRQFCEGILTAFDDDALHRFDWKEWVGSLDTALQQASERSVDLAENDIRTEAYGRFIYDLLSDWYRAALLTTTNAEVRDIYRAGMGALREVLDGLPPLPEVEEECSENPA